jgi:4'-phosphopantetheinyl transferase
MTIDRERIACTPVASNHAVEPSRMAKGRSVPALESRQDLGSEIIDDLPPSECHLWVARAPRALSAESVVKHEALLNELERTRYLSFRFERHRNLFLLTRALVRHTLSRYADVPPAEWRFATGSHGKPYIEEPRLPFSLAFNLSNTEGMVVCAVAREVDLGVDVEKIDRAVDPLSIADRFFSARELGDLRALPAALQRERFFAYWTLKESYIKARGLGLALPLDQFSFILNDQSVGLMLEDCLRDNAERWQCARVEIDKSHAIALSIARGSEPDLTIVVRHATLH